MNPRSTALKELQFDPKVPVVILGGGVNGIGLFRELALQGVRCLLVDKSDFTAGATSKSSRMIHGGLRYLEHRELALVRESLQERNRLLDNAGHYVFPLKTTIPFFSRWNGCLRSALIFCGFNLPPRSRGSFIIGLGLWCYDFLTRKGHRLPKHQITAREEALRSLPGLNPEITGTATYWDAMITEAERLCIEMIHDAHRARKDCLALNYVIPQGVQGELLLLKDLIGGETFAVEPQAVVNATGARVDATNKTLGITTAFIGGTKGSHLVLDCPDLYKALGDQMVYYQHDDGRVCIVFRFLDKIIMGSTDIPVDDPDKAACDEKEVEYMLTAIRNVFPNIKIVREHIVFAFCGVRPLPSTKDPVTANITRSHTIHVSEPAKGRDFPVINLIGGKWTAFRSLAEQAADKLLPLIGTERRCSTAQLPIGGGKDFPSTPEIRTQWIQRVAGATQLPETRIETLLNRYGTAAEEFAGADSTPLATLPDYTVGEIERIATTEHVERLADIVYRRSTIGMLGNATTESLTELSAIAGKVLGWDKERQSLEVTRALPPKISGAPRTGADKPGPSDWTRILLLTRSPQQ